MLRDRDVLRADCTSCFGLCCVIPAFSAATDFAIDKPANTPCPNLRTDSRCGIHDQLRQKGFSGCTVYDCFGTGQHISQVTFHGQDWRENPDIRTEMFATFPIMRQLHEFLWYLAEARSLPVAESLHVKLESMAAEVEQLANSESKTLLTRDIGKIQQKISALLTQTSNQVRTDVNQKKLDYYGADLLGANFTGKDLRGANFRGALLIGVNFRNTNLAFADFLGADLRGADFRDANLTQSLFLTQPQLTAANGNSQTTIPAALTHPPHWLT